MAKKPVFQEVAAGATTTAKAAARPAAREGNRAAVATWLWSLAALVSVMILVGGLTRLTDSGLSITVWDPVMGAIPPLSAADWEAAFDAYKTTTEYQEQNAWMTLADFKPIYWWEWGHRMLGRVIGLVWAVGLAGLLIARAVPPGWTGRLVLVGVLGGLQGAVGWWMVASGLTGRLDVASYRLATHLGLAFVILAMLAWFALKVRLSPVDQLQARRRRTDGLLGLGGALGALVFLQIVVGALVAGIDAGRSYVDWPLMQGGFLPPEPFELSPWWRNLFENAGTVQFVHRMLGYAVLGLSLVFAWRYWTAGHRATARWGAAVGVATIAQTVIGIWTVVNAAPLEIAIFHQAGAIVLWGVLFRAKFEAAYPREERIARA